MTPLHCHIQRTTTTRPLGLTQEQRHNFRIARWLFILAAVGTFVLLAGCAEANAEEVGVYVTGNDLLDQCRSDPGFCFGFIAGVSDMSESAVANTGTAAGLFQACVPAGQVPLKQLRDVVIKWLEANPDKRHYTGSSLVMAATAEAFPCQTSKGSF